MQNAVRSHWDELLQKILTALPRTRRDERKPRIVMLADRLQGNSQQLSRWKDEHWNDNTLSWSARSRPSAALSRHAEEQQIDCIRMNAARKLQLIG